MDLGTQFCERCGRDRDSFASARNTYRDCPACGAACCADCWNLVDGACLACAPFRLLDTTAPPRIVVAATPAPGPRAAADPYADLRGGEPPLDAWDANRGTARQRPKEAPHPGPSQPSVAAEPWRTGLAEAEPAPARAKRRRAGRVGLAASAAWVVVAGLAVVALGASPRAQVEAPPEASPSIEASPVVTAAPTRPPATPRATRQPRTTPRPTPQVVPANPGGPVTRATPRPTPRPTPRATQRPPKPVVVPPPATPRPTPAPTPEPTPVPTPDPSVESLP